MLQPNELNAAVAAIEDCMKQLRAALEQRGYTNPDIAFYYSPVKYSSCPFMLTSMRRKESRISGSARRWAPTIRTS